MSFRQNASDPSLYIATEGEKFIIAVYVDDIILAGKCDQLISQIKEARLRDLK